MNTSTFLKSNIRKSIVHLVVGLTAIKAISFYFPLGMIDGKYLWYKLGETLITILAFYINSLIFLPILLKQKNIKKYVLLTLISVFIYSIVISWLHALNSSSITYYENGNRPNPSDLFFQTRWIIMTIFRSLLSFIPFSLFTLLYSALIINRKEREGFFSYKYIEFIVNLIIITSIFLFLYGYSYKSQYIINSSLLLFCLIIFYANAFLISPILFTKQNYNKYGLYVSILFLLSVVSLILILNIAYNSLFGQNVIFVSVIILLLMLFSFCYSYIRLKLKAKEQLFNLKLNEKESELSLLKSQVNPHFLFNTLNTLYGTALEESAPKTAESTAKLASLIRYMQEDINKDFIPLENEINYLKDYIIIQKLRCSVEPEIEIKFQNVENHKISPGLLIPFVENAFKYGIDPSKKSKLSVSVICDKSNINFKCVNSYNSSFKTYYKEQGFGIGIKNAKQRLELVYPKNHTFEVIKENTIFSVKINITINKQ